MDLEDMNMPKKDLLARKGLVEYLADVPLNNETYEAVKEYTETLLFLMKVIAITALGEELENMNDDELKQFAELQNKELALNKKNIRASISGLAGRFLTENIGTIKNETEQMKCYLNELFNRIQQEQ